MGLGAPSSSSSPKAFSRTPMKRFIMRNRPMITPGMKYASAWKPTTDTAGFVRSIHAPVISTKTVCIDAAK